ncbi:MAG TPA: hypothetical protein VFZ64_00090 [Nocardioidaceae bacterium]
MKVRTTALAHHVTKVVAAVAVALGTLSAGLATAATAEAGEVVLTDPRGDMWKLESQEVGFVQAPRAASGDIRRSTFRHGKERVALRTRYAELTRKGDSFSYVARIRTDEKKRYLLTVTAARGSRGGDAELTRGWRDGARTVDCDVRHRIDYGRNTVRVVVPRDCLSAPRWVQLTNASYRVVGDRWLTDNPHGDQAESGAWTRRVRRG